MSQQPYHHHGGLPPAGWYPQGNVQRYWDGQQWTQHTHPPQSAQQPASAPFVGVPGTSTGAQYGQRIHGQHGRTAPTGKGRTVAIVGGSAVAALVVIGGIGAAVSGGSNDSTASLTPDTSSSAPPAVAETSEATPTPAGSTSTSKTSPAPEPSTSSSSRADDNPAFGQTVTFEDDSTLTCGKPVAFKPSEYSFGGSKAKLHLKVKCTFRNGSDETFNPALTDGSMTAGGQEGDSVYQDGLDAPENPVLPGKSVTWWMGYGVASKRDVQLTVRLGFLDYNEVTFS